uniref:NIT domain-containing protein n=1 Tax=Macrostomum lignano TaxID=282301 RepID=A0A1I8H0J9_9PLAT
MVAILAVFTLLLVQLPAAVRCKLTQNSLAELHGLETNISIAWRDNDRVMFESGVNTALLAEIPDAIVSITSSATEALVEIFEKDPKKATNPNVPTDPRKISRLKRISAMKILTPIFAILSVVADVLSMTVFAENNQFEDIYTYLQDQFIKVNAKIEANFHAIKELESIVLCGQVSKNLRSRQTLVKAFYNRYKQMLERAKTDRGEAMALFDTELPQYQSSLVLLELQQMLIDKSVYAQLLTYCARGDLMQYLAMMVELHHTFKQAI